MLISVATAATATPAAVLLSQSAFNSLPAGCSCGATDCTSGASAVSLTAEWPEWPARVSWPRAVDLRARLGWAPRAGLRRERQHAPRPMTRAGTPAAARRSSYVTRHRSRQVRLYGGRTRSLA